MKKLFLFVIIMFIVTPLVHAQGPKGYIIIPSIYLYKDISYVEIVGRRWDTSQLYYSTGHLEQTSWYDTDWGNVVIIGHTPGGFEDLTSLQLGDTIVIDALEYGVYEYTVSSMYITTINDLHPINPTQERVLTLITCHGEDRLIVRAYLK